MDGLSKSRQPMNSAAPLSILKSRFGYDSFLPLQEEIIDNVLARRDGLVLMPTGGGKSLCYQLPALIFDGVTLVISPLIALMKDQVDTLNATGIPARFINSSLPASEIRNVQTQVWRGQTKILYVAPERLSLPGFRSFLHNIDLSLIAIDEAHCISEWGHEFRPDYRNLRQLRQDFPDVPVIALTATATKPVREDIIVQLGLQRGEVFLSSFNRANLSYSVRPKSGSLGVIMSLLQQRVGQSAIIYCSLRQETEDIAEELNAQGMSARPYHAGLDGEVRRRTQEDFIRDRVPIIVATIAFGMGIDKPDIRLVVHYSLPKSLEGYYQETGRAGRDGLPGECVLFYSYSDKVKQDYFIERIDDETERDSARQKLLKMVEFAQLPTCRRRFILEYLGEQWTEENCGGCDVCLRSGEEFDATEIAQKILSAVIRTGEKFGANHVIQVLSGSRVKRVLELGHDRLSVYGIAKDFGAPQLRDIIGQLQARGLLGRTEGQFPTLAVTPNGREFLKRRQEISLLAPTDQHGSRPSQSGSTVEYDENLFEALRSLRKRLADARDVPAFVVFGDVSLRHMAATSPLSLEEFSRISGVGKVKLEQYGQDFLEVIRSHVKVNGLPNRGNIVPTDQKPKRRLGSTYDATRELQSKGLSISQIAQRRDLAETTIVAHLELIVAQGVHLDIEHLMPSEERLHGIEEAFNVCGISILKPAWEFLGTEYTYDELRLVRMYLRQEGRLAE